MVFDEIDFEYGRLCLEEDDWFFNLFWILRVFFGVDFMNREVLFLGGFGNDFFLILSRVGEFWLLVFVFFW